MPSRRDRDRGTALRKLARGRLTDPAARARHERHRPVESFHARQHAQSGVAIHASGGRIGDACQLTTYIRPLAATVARIAARQYGRITVEQLAAAGVDYSRVQRWLADGRLRREHQGVYSLGHADPSPHGVYLSAALAAGSGACVSHGAAAHLLGLLTGSPPRPEVTVPTTAGRTRPGIVIHRVRDLPFLDTSSLERIAITIVPRTLLDLAPRLSCDGLANACHEAWVRHRTAPDQIEACVARNPHKPGIARLREALRADVTLSVLEKGFLALVHRHGLPRPRTENIDHRGDKVDCRWPRARPDDRAPQLPLPRLAARVRGRRRATPALEPRRLHVR